MFELDWMPTPITVAVLEKVERNIVHMGDALKMSGMRHRPHIKTHKSTYFADMQVRLGGSNGITCAKLGEGEVFADNGYTDILLSNAIIGEVNMRRLIALAARVNVTLAVNNPECAQTVNGAGAALGRKLPVFIELDSGLGRGGVELEALADFESAIGSLPYIDIVGVMTYAGQIYSAKDEAEMREIARHEASVLMEGAKMLRERGHDIQVLSGGSSFSSKLTGELAGMNESRAGNYLFNDGAQLCSGLASVDECGLIIVTTVIGRTGAGNAIIDAGTKTLTSDTIAFKPGLGVIVECPEAEIFKANEEHGFVRFPGKFDPPVGTRLHIVPNHSCTAVNLCDKLVGVRDGKFERYIDIQARGKNV